MGLLNAFNEWKATRNEKYITRMQSENKCPDCGGRGYHIYPPASEFIPYDNTFDCEGCNGSGLYSDWTTE